MASTSVTLERHLPAEELSDLPTSGVAGRGRWRRWASGSAALILVAAVWELLPRLGVINPGFLPPLSTVMRTWWDLLTSGELGPDIEASVVRALEGLLAAVLVGVPLGLLIGWYRRASDFLNPVLEVFRNTSPIALLPVFILFLGIGEISKVAVIFYACLWPVLLNTVSGVRDVDPLLVKSARSLVMSPRQVFQKVVVPAALPTIFAGIRLAGTFSILMVIIAEEVGATSGLGYMVNNAAESNQIPQMYAAIVTITAVGLAVNGALVLLERRLLAWRPPPQSLR